MDDASAERPVLRADYRPAAFLIDTVALDVRLAPEATEVEARLAVRRNPAAEHAADLRLDGQELELLDVALDGSALDGPRYELEPERLVVRDVPDGFVLTTRVRIAPTRNKALEGLYLSNGVYCTQCEAEGFRRITFFPDRPDVMARYRVRVEAERATAPVLLSNGNPIDAGELPGGRHFAVWEDPHPKPCYLFALVAGDLGCLRDRFTTRSGRDVELRIYTEHDKLDQCDHAMASLKKSMRWDEDVFGLEYDLDLFMIVAVSDFNMGAMENKGLNIFNTKYVLAKPATATDQDYLGIERVIAHEYFHNWTGDRVTCRDWFQLTLKEGLTVFRDQEFGADVQSRPLQRIADVRRLRAGQFPEDAGPLAHPIRPDSYLEINNFYTPTVYEKGAEVIRMIHTLIGAEAFRRGMDLYIARHDNHAVTCEDFVAAMEDASGQDLTRFRRWYGQAGTPRIEARGRFDPARGAYELTLRQSTPPTPGQPVKVPVHLPVAMGLLARDGSELALQLEGENDALGTCRVLELIEPEQRFSFIGLDAPPVPSLLRGFSAPVVLDAGYADDELRFLFEQDPDSFARWEAGQTLATRLLLARVESADAGPPLPDAFVAACARILDDARLDAAYRAELLTLPSEAYLAEQMPVIDVDAIHAARRAARALLGTALAGRWKSLVEAVGDADYRIDPASIGRRGLRNLALAYLAAADAPGARERVRTQAEGGTNMTDVLAALALLADSDDPEREAVLAEFERKWRHEPLVIDKWFAVQASAQRAHAVETVAALLGHADFALTNPNRVRALLGTFAHGNPTGFHPSDGAGYRLIGEQIRALDAFNPQVAARLLQAFGRWRRFDPKRQAFMRAELEAALRRPGASRDVTEIASKSLAD